MNAQTRADRLATINAATTLAAAAAALGLPTNTVAQWARRARLKDAKSCKAFPPGRPRSVSSRSLS